MSNARKEGGVEGPNEKHRDIIISASNIALFFIPECFCLLLIFCFALF